MKSSFLLLLLLANAADTTNANITEKRDISIIGIDDRFPKGRVLVPHVAPVLFVRQTKGDSLPEKGSVSCTWKEEIHDLHPTIVGMCENGVEVVLTGLDLNY